MTLQKSRVCGYEQQPPGLLLHFTFFGCKGNVEAMNDPTRKSMRAACGFVATVAVSCLKMWQVYCSVVSSMCRMLLHESVTYMTVL